MSEFYVYVLISPLHRRFYIGQTNDLQNRLQKHNAGAVTSTKPYAPWELKGYIQKSSRKEAMVLEKKLKNLNTEDLKKFIEKHFSNAQSGIFVK
ncbi:MAG: GIY-YIG nuclease family protein [Bacteroidia bacterium]